MSRVPDSPVAPRIGAAGPRAVRRIAPAGGRAETAHRAVPPLPRHRSTPDGADDARRRLPVAVVLAVPVVVLGAVPALRFADWAWASLCLAAPALAGLAILVSSLRLRSLRSARPPAHHRA